MIKDIKVQSAETKAVPFSEQKISYILPFLLLAIQILLCLTNLFCLETTKCLIKDFMYKEEDIVFLPMLLAIYWKINLVKNLLNRGGSFKQAAFFVLYIVLYYLGLLVMFILRLILLTIKPFSCIFKSNIHRHSQSSKEIYLAFWESLKIYPYLVEIVKNTKKL